MKRAIAFLFFLLVSFQAHGATTLLPNGKQCFTDANGAVVNGSVNMFVPNTTTPKATWQDANQTVQNSQPLQLDNNGCAVIYGVGQYRQQLFDGPVVSGATSGNLLFDQLTTDTSAFNSVFWAGLSAGTPNVITIVDTGFNGTDGTVIQFIALATNTGSVTLNPSAFGAIAVVKDTTSGPVALTGGEITAGNVISVVYYATGNQFHLLNTVIASASGATAPLCGASGLSISNDAGTPNSIIDITATQSVTQSTSGLVINRGSISVTVNISTGTATSTAGGMDGESPGTSAWLYLWLIDNGSSQAGLASVAAGNGLSPNMPSGYTYKCRVGAVRVDGSTNLLRTQQKGQQARYVVTSATNTAALPTVQSGATGSVSVPTYTAKDVSALVPATATGIIVVPQMIGAANVTVLAAPNNNYGAWNSATNPPPIDTSTGATTSYNSASPAELQLESTNIYVAILNASGALYAYGWRDAVNAN